MTSRHFSPPTGSPVVRPSELQFVLPEPSTRFGTLLGGASATHLGLLALLFFIIWVRPPGAGFSEIPSVIDRTKLVFVPHLAPSGGDGGGGNKSLAPMRTSPILAVRPPEAIIPTPTSDPTPVVDVEPAAIVRAAVPNHAPPAMVETGPPNVGELGLGDGPGAGLGPGGIGTGPHRGAGKDGNGPGCCGPGAGGGVTAPSVIERVRPAYSSEAMLRGVKGEVALSCVVLETGAMGPCDIVRSLDSNVYGLDSEALKAAAKWRFKPGMSSGRPVQVRVNIVLEFNMR